MPETNQEDEIVIEHEEAPAPGVTNDSTQRRDDEHFRREERQRPADQPVHRDTSRRVAEDDEDLGPRVQKRLNQFRRRTGDAEARAAALEADNRRLTSELHATSTNAFAHYESAALARLESAKREAQEAYESGDGQKVVEANRKLASAQVAIDNVEAQKGQRATQEAQRAAQPAQPQQPTYSPKTKAWVDDNPWFDTDPEARKDALRVHDRLIREGFTPESDKYFNELNKRCAALFPEHFSDTGNDDDEVDEEPQGRRHQVAEEPVRRAPPVAAASRQAASPNLNPRRVVTYKLTKDEQEAASIAGVSEKAYAVNLPRYQKGARS